METSLRRNRGLISGAYVLLVENLVLICNSISQSGNIAEGHLVPQYCLQFFKKSLIRWADEPNSAYQGFANLLRERNRGNWTKRLKHSHCKNSRENKIWHLPVLQQSERSLPAYQQQITKELIKLKM